MYKQLPHRNCHPVMDYSRLVMGCFRLEMGYSRLVMGCFRLVMDYSRLEMGCFRLVMGC